MRAEVLPEPELEFGGGGRHIDPRFGLTNYGPADLTAADAPHAIRVGLVGAEADLDTLRHWLERCRDPIPAKDERYPHLFPGFPGCDVDRGLHTAVVATDRASNTITARTLRRLAEAGGTDALRIAVDAYTDEVRILAEQNRVDVVIIARPGELRDSSPRKPPTQRSRRARQKMAATKPGARDERCYSLDRRRTAEPPNVGGKARPTAMPEDVNLRYANFHDVIKARLLTLGVPVQIMRRSSFDEAATPPVGSSRQDEATRAWNLHVALYYKAGGVPWRLIRDSRDVMTLFVGVSFYGNDLDETLETAVAQVFNERGDGVIVRGGAARSHAIDRQPHLTEDAAHGLLSDALDTYRREHMHLPARVVIHKASRFIDGERAGFEAAADERDVEELDLTWITASEGTRLFRRGAAPPLRGTHAELGPRDSLLYSAGSIDFYSTYPGMYVPQPIGLRHVRPSRSLSELAAETLALTKMNWNQTRLDGKMPVTLRTAEQVKHILRFCTNDTPIATRYAHYM